MYKKIGILLIILLLTIMPCFAELGTDFKAPEEFEHSKYWEKNNFNDIYSLKSDENTQLEIEKFEEGTYHDFTTTNPEINFYATPLENNIIMGISQDTHEGFVTEVVEHNGEKYLIRISVLNNVDDNNVKDTVKYLEEFNKLNNVEPLQM